MYCITFICCDMIYFWSDSPPIQQMLGALLVYKRTNDQEVFNLGSSLETSLLLHCLHKTAFLMKYHCVSVKKPASPVIHILWMINLRFLCHLLHRLEESLAIILKCHDEFQLSATRLHSCGKREPLFYVGSLVGRQENSSQFI